VARERLRRLHCLPDRVAWQRRLKVRLQVNFFFSALTNSRTRGVQAGVTIASGLGKASEFEGAFESNKYAKIRLKIQRLDLNFESAPAT
jgi:hypothetical protein